MRTSDTFLNTFRNKLNYARYNETPVQTKQEQSTQIRLETSDTFSVKSSRKQILLCCWFTPSLFQALSGRGRAKTRAREKMREN